jgi:Escherichia/Staphylococcus phage prohead protease
LVRLARVLDDDPYPAVKETPSDFLTLPLWLTETKADTDAGTVSGYLAVFNNLDLTKDIIHPGAFAKTLSEARAFARAHHTSALYPLLWQHDKHEPIGGIYQAHEDSHGLLILARINPAIERGRQALFGLQYGAMAFSIGYRPVAYDWEGRTRHLREIDLIEGSVVTFPANPEARPIAA